MGYAPRLLSCGDEENAKEELLRIGCDPEGVRRMIGKMVSRTVLLHGVPCRAANVIKQEMLAIGGDAAVARGTVACSIPHTDVILIGHLKQLRRLCRRLLSQPFGLPQLAAELETFLNACSVPPALLKGRDCQLDLAEPVIMGILNVTPDSFSDGGRYFPLQAAVEQGLKLAGEGAGIVDIGGESTRPGAPAVSAEEELARVLPVVEALRAQSSIPISVDTTKSQVARAVLAGGANFINDISGLDFDSEMAAVIADFRAGAFLMHTRGTPEAMQQNTDYDDLVGEVVAYLQQSLERATAAGIEADYLSVDPGIGFGKNAQGNLQLLKRLQELTCLGRPILLGTSRKNFIGKILNQPVADQRLYGTLATVALGVQQGAKIFRVHDVRPALETARLAWAICQA